MTGLRNILLILAVAVTFTTLAARVHAAAPAVTSEVPGYSIDDLRVLADNLTSTGVGRDAIRPISRPQFMSVSDASLSMDDRDPVFVVHYPNGLTRVYPQAVMVWHEIVNDVLPLENEARVGSRVYSQSANQPGNSYTITYSPLTGCVTAFKSMAGRFPSSFGNEGRLLNNNTVLYDRSTAGVWCQLLAVCIEGPLRGRRLDRIPVYWSRWGGVKNRYPEAQVLSRATGMRRSYGRDPYGSYFTKGNYYDNSRIVYPVSALSNKLPPKERILGLEMDSNYGALVRSAVKEARVMNLSLGVSRLVALYDEELDRIRVFNRELPDGSQPDFEIFEKKYVDSASKSEWNSDGVCIYGRYRGQSLTPVLAVDAMWFAWYAFHPATVILDKESVVREQRGPDIP